MKSVLEYLQNYYRFERVSDKGKTRMDCTASTGDYEPFEQNRAARARKETESGAAIAVGDLLLHFLPAEYSLKATNVKRISDRRVQMKSGQISSIYPFKEEGEWRVGYGDYKGDFLLFKYKVLELNGIVQPGSVIEIFIAREKGNECRLLCNYYEDEYLYEDMEALREKAKKERAGRDSKCMGNE